jgi:hypothetical protein
MHGCPWQCDLQRSRYAPVEARIVRPSWDRGHGPRRPADRLVIQFQTFLSANRLHGQNDLAAHRSEQTDVFRTDRSRFRYVPSDQNAGDRPGYDFKASSATGSPLSTTDVAAIQADRHRWSGIGRRLCEIRQVHASLCGFSLVHLRDGIEILPLDPHVLMAETICPCDFRAASVR